MSIQTRSEENGLQYFDTIREAMEHAKQDPSVWKVSFYAENGERVRLIRGKSGKRFVYAPIKLPRPEGDPVPGPDRR